MSKVEPKITVNNSIRYWNKSERDAVKLLIVTEYKTRKLGKVKHTAPTIIRPNNMKISHLNQLTKIIAIYGMQK